MPACGIYSVYRLRSPSGRSYIGQTSLLFEERLKKHSTDATKKKLHYSICRAIRKYGLENFQKEIVYQTKDKEDCSEMEKFFINHFNSFSNGYNLSLGGESGSFGCKWSEESKKKVTGRKLSSTTVERMKMNRVGMKGKRHSEETKRKISISKRKGAI